MRKFSFFGSLMSAVLIAVIAFFVLYFFVPSLSNEFFGFSYRSSRDADQLQEAVTDILSEARVPKVAIDEYMAKFETAEFKRKLTEAAATGKDAVVDVLAKAGEGIDFGTFDTHELKDTLSSGLSRLSEYSSQQWKSLQRIFAGAMDNL